MSGTGTRPRPRFDPNLNLYHVLDVPVTASQAEITRAYRNLIRLTHPDTLADADAQARRRAEERTRMINAAWDVLSKPEIRREYDQTLRNSAVNDLLMQRYSGGAGAGTGRNTTTLRPAPKPPSPRVVRAQKAAYRSAVGQFLGVVLAFTAAVLLIALLFGVLAQL